MRKFLITFITGLISLLNVYSDPVKEQEARKIAENFYNAYAPSSKAGSSINKLIKEKYEGEESFFIYGFEKGGFVIISADDHAIPVLGYSFNSPVSENIGSNIRYLFDCYNQEIKDVKSLKTKNEDIKSEWERLRTIKLSGEKKAVGPLLETTWDQLPYYNQYCPSGAPTGCVATAMSQIMNYHKWPVSGNGWHKYIPESYPEYGKQYADFSSIVYDWENMPVDLSESSTTKEKEAVATLSYHAGVAVNMDYGPTASGALDKDVLYALTSYFKYDPTTIEYVNYDSDEETAYLNKIKLEIDNNRPIFYSGIGSSGGHAWVCDGYDDDNMVHMNWGWGGSYNGYFLLSNMASSSYDFTSYNSMIIGIQPGITGQEMLWTKKASGFQIPARGIQHISVVDNRIAWAIAYDGSGNGANLKEFTRTIDGNNWVAGTINVEGTNNYGASMIHAIDKNTAWVPLYSPNGGGKILKTEDGGKTWEHQSSAAFASPNGFPNIVHFWDANNGWCQGDPFELYITTDGGNKWGRVPEENIPANLDGEYGIAGYYAVYGDIVWFSTNKGRIFKSTDKGYSWSVYQTPLTEAFDLSFRNESVGIIQVRRSGNNNKVQYITNDGGKNWTALSPVGNFYTFDFTYVPGTNVLISTGLDYQAPYMGISYSIDDGITFTDYAEFYKDFQFSAIGVAGIDAIWAGAFNVDENNKGMWHYGNTLISTEFTTDKNSYCVNDDVIFNDNSYGSPESWVWNFGEGAIPSTATGKGPHTVSYSTSGNKKITLTVERGTGQYTLEESEYITGSVPEAAGAITGETNVGVGETHTYTVVNQDNVIFKWEVPDPWQYYSSTTNKIDIEFIGSNTGTVTVTPSNACGDGASASLEIIAGSSTGIEGLGDEFISIYPNPAKDFINILGADESNICIYNDSGILVKKIGKSEVNSPINISGLSTGIYHVQVIIKDKTYTKIINVLEE